MKINELANLADGTYIVTDIGTALLLADYDNGYWVGEQPIDSADLTEFTLFGVWTNAKGIKEYDLVIFEEDFESALRTAKKYNQKAIWDNKNSREITVAI